MKMRKKEITRWTLFMLWITVIFIMSQLPGDKSSEQSQLVVKLFSIIGLDLNGYFGEMGTLIVRKGAHFTEYLILFILTYRVLILYMEKNMSRLLAIVFVFLYACSDEFHQSFIIGRTAAFTDVLIDTSGGIFACIVGNIISKVKKKDVL
ncbi:MULTISPECIES: VanZ family protein [Clostridium]|uniref:VanZ family protein n=1 Tax=Clostridium cibarium TaxID=2762247 RepID=A0ABR8PYV7_9CLOT|nr:MULTISPECIES: VanZ family protein [Clostridium]MBD7913360.1 VanZ family protein [Clostridium cibarium]